MATQKTAKKKAKKANPHYVATLVAMGRTFEGKGKDIETAIKNLNLDGLVRTKCVLTISKGDKHKERVFPPAVFNRLFMLSPFAKELQLRQLSALFDI